MLDTWKGGPCKLTSRYAAFDDLPPPFNRGIVGDAVIGPSQLIIRVFETVFNPGAQPIGIAHGLPDIAHKT